MVKKQHQYKQYILSFFNRPIRALFPSRNVVQFVKAAIYPAKVVENCKVYSAQFRLLKIAFSSRKMEIKHFYSWPQANLFAMYLSSLPGQRKITHPTPKQYFLEKSISPSRKDSVIFIPIC